MTSEGSKKTSKEKNFCGICKAKGKNVALVEKYDVISCPECKTTAYLKEKHHLSIGRYQKEWKENSEDYFPMMKPAFTQEELKSPRLFFLYEDCYQTFLIGRYNASIILMGVLLEAVLKERIFLKTGEYFTAPFGSCLKKVEDEKLMDCKDILFLKRFKDEVRNPYQHSDERGVVQGINIPVWKVEFEEGKVSLEKLESSLEDIRKRKMKPKLVPASISPSIRSIVKQERDKKKAFALLNEVHDFLQAAMIKYFTERDWEEHRNKFGSDLDAYFR